MVLNHNLNIGDVISNNDINRIFGVALQGGIRISSSKNNNCIVLIHDPSEIYRDRYIGGILYYTGDGRKGSQSLERGNKSLANSEEDGKTIYLFEKITVNRYRYLGIVYLALAGDIKYKEEWQYDENGKQRAVYVFPLELTGEASQYLE